MDRGPGGQRRGSSRRDHRHSGAAPVGQCVESPAASPAAAPHTDAAAARQLLQMIPVRGRAPKTGYRRDLYGHGWPIVAGCDMRNRILSRDLVNIIYRPEDTRLRRRVRHLARPLHGAILQFRRGNATSALVQIDHRYPLALSYQQGAATVEPGEAGAVRRRSGEPCRRSGQDQPSQGSLGARVVAAAPQGVSMPLRHRLCGRRRQVRPFHEPRRPPSRPVSLTPVLIPAQTPSRARVTEAQLLRTVFGQPDITGHAGLSPFTRKRPMHTSRLASAALGATS